MQLGQHRTNQLWPRFGAKARGRFEQNAAFNTLHGNLLRQISGTM